MKRFTVILVLALALAGCGGAEGESSDAGSSEPLAFPGTVAYYRAELSKIGLTSEATDGELVNNARGLCDEIEKIDSAATVYGASVRTWEDEGHSNPEAAAEAWLEMSGYLVVSPADLVGFRDAVVEEFAVSANAIAGGSGTEKGEIWAENEATLGDCYSEWRRMTELAQG